MCHNCVPAHICVCPRHTHTHTQLVEGVQIIGAAFIMNVALEVVIFLKSLAHQFPRLPDLSTCLLSHYVVLTRELTLDTGPLTSK